MRGKEQIIFGYLIFFVVVSQITAMGAPTIFEGVLDNPNELVCEPRGILGTMNCVWQNMTIFFRLMTVDTNIALLSTIFVIPFVIMIAWVILRFSIDILNAVIPG